MDYSLAQFEQDMTSLKPRFADIYIIPGLLVMASVKAGKKPLGKWTRRAMFVSGLYMLMRNYKRYEDAVKFVANFKPEDINQIISEVTSG